jgi:hypothetical protein
MIRSVSNERLLDLAQPDKAGDGSLVHLWPQKETSQVESACLERQRMTFPLIQPIASFFRRQVCAGLRLIIRSVLSNSVAISVQRTSAE